jgi:hypothetical protein
VFLIYLLDVLQIAQSRLDMNVMTVNLLTAMKFAVMALTMTLLNAMMEITMTEMGNFNYIFNTINSCDAECMVETGYDCTGGTTSSPDTCTKLDYLSGTLAECQAYAAIFYSTCTENGDETAPTFGAMASEA